ncbi:MAG TPA: hypothetical protein VMH61_03365 [Candidatus Acidoferrales bacterium]|nr:hypothetical protein [Candidatus Acidoferrales bacterium]
MAQDRQLSAPPMLAGPLRRVFHTLLAVAGWALFGYWWWIVARRVSASEVRFTVLFIAFSLVAIVLVTAAWALHNLRVFRRRGARKALRDVPIDLSHDGVGREVLLPTLPEECRTAKLIEVRIRDGFKVYDAGTGSGAAGPGGRRP